MSTKAADASGRGGMVWRHYRDQASLDAQFTLDSIPDLPSAMEKRLAMSRAARASTPHRLAIPYGDDSDATLDLFLPPANARRPAPVLMFIHGGFWKSLDAATFSFVGGAFAPAGALVAVIDFPLIPRVRVADIVNHTRQAICWLVAHAGEHGGDPGRIHIGGHSSGGHLTALALDPVWHEAAGVPAGAIRGGLAISGVFDLEPLRLSFQQKTIGLTVEEVAEWSPARRAPSGAAPLIAAVGGAETQEFVDQSLDFAQAWRAAGNAIQTHVVAQANHIDILTDVFAREGTPLNSAVRNQMGLDALA